MKTVKKMVRFFDTLYVSREAIGETVLEAWSHKETPKEVYAVIDEEDANAIELSLDFVDVYENEADAIEEMNEYNA